jgi:hypothetical protein
MAPKSVEQEERFAQLHSFELMASTYKQILRGSEAGNDFLESLNNQFWYSINNSDWSLLDYDTYFEFRRKSTKKRNANEQRSRNWIKAKEEYMIYHGINPKLIQVIREDPAAPFIYGMVDLLIYHRFIMHQPLGYSDWYNFVSPLNAIGQYKDEKSPYSLKNHQVRYNQVIEVFDRRTKNETQQWIKKGLFQVLSPFIPCDSVDRAPNKGVISAIRDRLIKYSMKCDHGVTIESREDVLIENLPT